MTYDGQPITKEVFKELIWKHHGIITMVCLELDINFP